MNNQRTLERLLIEELRKHDALEDIICEYEIESVRECCYCKRLMNEGWMYQNIETLCSDKCLMKAHPNASLESIRLHADDDDADTYWTEWGI